MNTQHTTTDEDDFPESELVPGLGFNGLPSMIGSYLRRLFKRLTTSH
jgi:hypothetical protein